MWIPKSVGETRTTFIEGGYLRLGTLSGSISTQDRKIIMSKQYSLAFIL